MGESLEGVGGAGKEAVSRALTLIAGKLAHLPRSPFEQTTTSCGQGATV